MLRVRLYLIIALLCALIMASGQAYVDTMPDFHPETVSPIYFTTAVNKLSLKKFSPDSALQLLYPGKRYKFKYQSDDYTLMAWRCPECPMVFSADEWYLAPDTFPIQQQRDANSDGMDTRILASLPFKNTQGHRCILFTTSTTNLGDVILVGRFNCAWLGLAVFEQINNSWLVTAFNPAVLCTGNFSLAHVPELLTVNGITQTCKIESDMGPGGGPYNGSINIIGLTQQTMHRLLTKKMMSRSNSLNAWQTTTGVSPDTTQPAPQLTLTTTGQFIRSALADDYDSTAIINALNPEITTRAETGFTIVTRYRYNPTSKMPYTLIKKTVTLQPLVRKKE